MRVFVIIATKNSAEIEQRILEKELVSLRIKSDVWPLVASAAARELAEQLGIRNGEIGSGLVCSIESYSGRLPKDTWEWLAVHEVESE